MPRPCAQALLREFTEFLFEQVGALERLIHFQASLQTPSGVPLQVVPAMEQLPSQALDGFFGCLILRFPGQFAAQIIEALIHSAS